MRACVRPLQSSAVAKQMRSAVAARWVDVINRSTAKELNDDKRRATKELTHVPPFQAAYETLLTVLDRAPGRYGWSIHQLWFY